MINQEELKEVLKYSPEEGIFIWLNSKGSCRKGAMAGSVHKTGYHRVVINRKSYLLHRLAWMYTYGEFPKNFIDHIDGNKSNNRLSNLRVCSQSENMQNSKLRLDNTSGFKGVSQISQTGKWQVNASLQGKITFLGQYVDKEEAINTYKAFCLEHHGEFYRDTTITEGVLN